MTKEDLYKTYFGIKWYEQLKEVLHSDYFNDLRKFLYEEKKTKIVYPKKMDLAFRAFHETPFDKVKIVIIGQDIYHDNSFDGLAFSNSTRKGMSPSLRNILLEVKRDYYKGEDIELSKDLSKWANQGVFLINVGLSVVKGTPGSHIDRWKPFMLEVIKKLNENRQGIIYLLWGKFAQNYKQFINPDKNYILEAGHPSPLNTHNPFRGCSHFSKSNEILKENKKKEIVW
jgi:uracil-DNA glycosylase